MTQQLDLLAPLEPPPPEPGIAIGTFRGDLAALDAAAAAIEVYCGPVQGWRRLGERISPSCCLVQYQGVLMAGPSYAVLPPDPPPAPPEPPPPEDQESES